MADKIELDRLSLAHEVEVVDLTGGTTEEESVKSEPSSGYLTDMDSDSDRTVIGGTKKVVSGETTDEEGSIRSESSSGYLTDSDSDYTAGGSKKVVFGDYDTEEETLSIKSKSSSGYLADSESEHGVGRGSKKVFTGNSRFGHYSKTEEHLDGGLTNEELDKEYPKILAHMHTTGYEGQAASSILLPTKSAGQKQAQSTHGESTRHEDASANREGSFIEQSKKSKEVVKMSSSNMVIKNADEKGIFCCNGNDGTFKLDERSSSAIIPDTKHADIKAFMEAVNAGDIQYAIGKVALEDVQKITVVIKVNIRQDHEDIATVFFAATAEFVDKPEKKYTAFAALDKPQAFELNGERGYFAYFCKTHRKYVRVGQHAIKWTSKKSWARWENFALDDLMGHPKKPVINYGQPAIDFRGLR